MRKTKLVGGADICIADRDEEGGHETKRRGIFRADGGSGRCLWFQSDYSLPEVLLHATSFWQRCLSSQPGNSSLMHWRLTRKEFTSSIPLHGSPKRMTKIGWLLWWWDWRKRKLIWTSIRSTTFLCLVKVLFLAPQEMFVKMVIFPATTHQGEAMSRLWWPRLVSAFLTALIQ